ncbi:hypothetical protein RD792_015426 [Penstemon davidsonii]|uniref:LOB domain-containing protein n=1 Tax=Penstemon davidsonii TaxID=160366 RepID=A0ABR0CSL7_9LAMI|nr:hypothetical protein RD792_015426 [Penstemon davidsonii]
MSTTFATTNPPPSPPPKPSPPPRPPQILDCGYEEEATFKSLLYEACGRIINPTHGSVGLMSSDNWQRCEAAVEAVLQGSPLGVSGDDDSSTTGNPFHRCDIRHLSKESVASLHRVRTRNRFKRSGSKSYADSVVTELMSESDVKFTITGWEFVETLNRAPSQDSFSVERVKPEPHLSEIGLELTLGLNPNPMLQNYNMSTVIEISDG